MKKSLLTLASLLILGSSSFAATTTNDEPTDKQKHKTTKLFNGKDLDGWYTFIRDRGRNNDPKGVFTVQDGLLRVSGEEWGCITTESEYDNYTITVRYKWGEATHSWRAEKARDSGLLFHSQGEDGSASGCWMTSLECNIIEGRTGDFIVVGGGTDKFWMYSPIKEADGISEKLYYYTYGGDMKRFDSDDRVDCKYVDPAWQDVINFKGKNDLENPHGEWNTLECVIIADEVYVFLNGHFINYATDIFPTTGRIQIQSEGAEIYFSDIILKEL